MNRDFELESKIRDSKLDQINISYSFYSQTMRKENEIRLRFIKFEKDLIEIILIKPVNMDLFHDNIDSVYIGELKVFSENNKIIICLDPFDERVDEIQDQDNFIFEAIEYKIVESKLT